jgi:hypothetical protein
MITDVPTNVQIAAAPQQGATSVPVAESTSFDERWAAWHAKGAAHDRAVRRKLGFVAPVLLVIAAAVLYALLGR